jgi:hypothetical protein
VFKVEPILHAPVCLQYQAGNEVQLYVSGIGHKPATDERAQHGNKMWGQSGGMCPSSNPSIVTGFVPSINYELIAAHSSHAQSPDFAV